MSFLLKEWWTSTMVRNEVIEPVIFDYMKRKRDGGRLLWFVTKLLNQCFLIV